MVKEGSLIHLKFNHNEAVNGKKDVLSSQINTLNMINHIKNYKTLRIQELKNKEKIRSKIKSLKSDLAKLQRTLPKIKIPEILKKEKPITKEDREEVKTLTKYASVEEQLRLIQSKLKELETD